MSADAMAFIFAFAVSECFPGTEKRSLLAQRGRVDDLRSVQGAKLVMERSRRAYADRGTLVNEVCDELLSIRARDGREISESKAREIAESIYSNPSSRDRDGKALRWLCSPASLPVPVENVRTLVNSGALDGCATQAHLHSKELAVTGTPDYLDLDGAEPRVVELKTASVSTVHAVQVCTYAVLAEQTTGKKVRAYLAYVKDALKLVEFDEDQVSLYYAAFKHALGLHTALKRRSFHYLPVASAVPDVYTSKGALADPAETLNNEGMAPEPRTDERQETDRLEEAVAAYRARLEARTLESSPGEWAQTQLKLGNALWSLGEREEGTARLEEAAAAFRATLEVYTREAFPAQWAMTQNNLGVALRALGEREEDTERLEEAVRACRAALEVRTREAFPAQWATTQNNLGTALQALGGREEDTDRLEEAATAYRAALEVYTRKAFPAKWAMTQNNLGVALQALGEREEGTARLKDAATAYRAALEVWTEANFPHYHAGASRNLVRALVLLAERGG